MHKFYNPKRPPVNVVLADGASALVGGHKILITDVISASIRRAVAKGLLKELIEPTVEKVVNRALEDTAQPTVAESAQESVEFNPEGFLSVTDHENTFSGESLEVLDEVISGAGSLDESETQEPQSGEVEESTKRSSRRKKRGL